MKINIKKVSTIEKNQNSLILLSGESLNKVKIPFLSKEETEYVISKFTKDKIYFFPFNRLSHFILISVFEENKTTSNVLETLRKSGNELLSFIKQNNIQTLSIIGENTDIQQISSFIEGIILGNYQFLKYKPDAKKGRNKFFKRNIHSA